MKQNGRKRLSRFFSILGPGVITGAADDDPSGIATYSMAGAMLGTGLLWTALLTWPLMAAVQMMCARIGIVRGMGLVQALRQKIPKPVIVVFSLALFVANTINIGADLLGMADAAQMLLGLNRGIGVALFGIAITVSSIRCNYQQIARILKWLALSLFAYVFTAFIARPDWSAVLHDTLVPTLPHRHEALGMLVAILGTTISPYLFVWQASLEVEEQKNRGLNRVSLRQGASKSDLRDRTLDITLGTFFSNIIMFFIILTTGLTLHQHGITEISTTKEAAKALTPLAGKFAAALFTIGIIGVGILSIPTLAGSAAYAFAETFAWKQGLDAKPKTAWRFYTVFALSMAAGMAMYLLKINAVHALYWTAVINGILAPFLLVGILLVASNRQLMHQQTSSRLALLTVAVTTLLMFVAAIGMFLF